MLRVGKGMLQKTSYEVVLHDQQTGPTCKGEFAPGDHISVLSNQSCSESYQIPGCTSSDVMPCLWSLYQLKAGWEVEHGFGPHLRCVTKQKSC